ncbi:peptidoglycan D,D-transpeptidase FtsI family protein [Caulobacter sp. UC70_42]|uniref:peptidoglycan D,D-transpeptidase FtsI family protein n=1 Tax=Caulobacter sp. UC70_42 TaxID=3374551 RepID=UPI0037576E82
MSTREPHRRNRPLAETSRLRTAALAAIWRIEHGFEHARRARGLANDTRLRILAVACVLGLGFLGLAIGAVSAALWPSPAPRSTALFAAQGRGDLVDRRGSLLATDLPVYGLYYDPQLNWDPGEVRARLPALAPGLTPARLAAAVGGDHRQYLIGDLSPQQKAAIDDLGLPGVSFEPEVRRVYPAGPVAGHLVGFTQRGGEGLAGAERALDRQLVGRAEGDATPLSMDLRVQAALDSELSAAATRFSALGAVGVVTNVHTGEILALSSWPALDPAAPGAGPRQARIDHAVTSVYEPGSIFKVFTLAMGLDAGLATIDTPFDARAPLTIGRQTIHDYDKDNAVLPLWKVFTHSSNIGAARLGLMVGADRMRDYLAGLGLLDAAPVQLPGSARPILPRTFTDNAVASMAFGSAISVSPLAIAAGMDTVLNGGDYVPLTIAPRASAPNGRRVISAATSRTMLNLMRLNVLQGTGGKARVSGYRVGGKTGSQEKVIDGHYDRHKLVSSFAAVFPTDGALSDDRYVVLIMLDEPHATPETFGFATGGWTAAPTAGRVIARIAPFLNVPRRPPVTFEALPAGDGSTSPG